MFFIFYNNQQKFELDYWDFVILLQLTVIQLFSIKNIYVTLVFFKTLTFFIY